MTRQEWYRYIWNEATNYPELGALAGTAGAANAQQLFAEVVANPSRQAFTKLLVWCCACVAAQLEALLAQHKAEQNELNARKKIGALRWLEAEVMQYRFNAATGLPWAFTEDPGTYAPVYGAEALADASALLVSQAVARDGSEGVVLLVAKGQPGSLARLESAELEGLRAYVRRIEFAGQFIEVLSLAADRVRYAARLEYDPLKHTRATAEAAIRAAASAYLAGAPRGTATTLGQIDAWQALDGITPVAIDLAEGQPDGGVYQAFDFRYDALAGYMVFDQSSTITLVPAA